MYTHCSFQPYHMSAAALNAFHSLLLKQVTGNNSLSINVYNHPFPRNITAQADTVTQNNVGFGIGILVVFGYSFLLASFVLFLVAEKESKVHMCLRVRLHGDNYTNLHFLCNSSKCSRVFHLHPVSYVARICTLVEIATFCSLS